MASAGVIANPVNYYFDSRYGNDKSNGLSIATAWKTLNNIRGKTFLPGDSLLFRKGSYWKNDSMVMKSSGTLSLPIVCSSYGTHTDMPVIENPGQLLIVLQAQYIIIEKLKLLGGKFGAVSIGDSLAKHIVVQDMELANGGCGIAVSGDSIVLQRNVIHDLVMVVNTPGLAGTKEAIDDYGAVGINLNHANHIVIRNNTMINCRAPSADYGFDGGAIEFWGDVNGAEIYGNTSISSEGFLEFGGRTIDTVKNVRIHHNLAVETGSLACFHVGSRRDAYGIQYANVRIDNNTVVNNRITKLFVSVTDSLADSSSIQVRNNIFTQDTIGYIFSGVPFVHKNNRFWAKVSNRFPKTMVVGSKEHFGDPGYLGWGNQKYALSPTSTAIDRGDDLGYSADFLGNPALNKLNPDLGAFEYQDTTGIGLKPKINTVGTLQPEVIGYKGGIRFKNFSENTEVTVRDIQNRQILKAKLSQDFYDLAVRNAPQGVYICTFSGSKFVGATKVTITR